VVNRQRETVKESKVWSGESPTWDWTTQCQYQCTLFQEIHNPNLDKTLSNYFKPSVWSSETPRPHNRDKTDLCGRTAWTKQWLKAVCFNSLPVSSCMNASNRSGTHDFKCSLLLEWSDGYSSVVYNICRIWLYYFCSSSIYSEAVILSITFTFTVPFIINTYRS